MNNFRANYLGVPIEAGTRSPPEFLGSRWPNPKREFLSFAGHGQGRAPRGAGEVEHAADLRVNSLCTFLRWLAGQYPRGRDRSARPLRQSFVPCGVLASEVAHIAAGVISALPIAPAYHEADLG